AFMLIVSPLSTISAYAASATDEATLRQMITDAGSTPVTIDLEGTIDVESTIVIPSGADVTLRPALEDDATLQRTQRDGGRPLLRVEEDAKLTLDANASGQVIVTSNGFSARVLDVAGTVIMNDGVLTGMKGDPATSGILDSYDPRAAVSVSGNGKMTMNGGAIAENEVTGGNLSGQDSAGNLVVFNGGKFILTDGEIRNGKAPRSAVFSAGGVALINGAEFEMSGGSITGNQGGTSGGIHIHAGELDWDDLDRGDLDRWKNDEIAVNVSISGGEISRNTSVHYGGGIGGIGKFTIQMSGGEITGNKAPWGGGVHVQDLFVKGGSNPGTVRPDCGQELVGTIDEWSKIVPAGFRMTGGKISGNVAFKANSSHFPTGGGINIVSNSVELLGGEISGNSVVGDDAMGGGVYVSTQPYTLKMKNVWFDSNDAGQGGAIWNCPTGHTTLHVEDGAYFSDNTAEKYGRDVQIFPLGKGADGPPLDMRLPIRLLGGERIDWFVDGYYDRYPTEPRFSPDNPGKPLDLTALQSDPKYIGLAGHRVIDTDTPGAEGIATLVIRENEGDLGGGLGTNGNVIIGTDTPTVGLKVTKKWLAGGEIPDELEITLRATDSSGTTREIDHAILTEENNWEAEFTDLPQRINGEFVEYSVAEATVSGWTTVISDPVSSQNLPAYQDGTCEAGQEKCGDIQIALTNTALISVTGHKIWTGEADEHPTIELQLYRALPGAEAEPVGEPQTLADGETSVTWEDLPATSEDGTEYIYTVDEVAVPEGYEKVVSDDGLTIENKLIPEEPEPTPTPTPTTPETPDPELPKTGVNLGIMAGLSAIFLVGGAALVTLRRRA
ncbi:MAG: Cna B-type domain-containing protein, partial [Actinomycetaceae bacterium]|nr:Cna B-type domain-containing protein [Actinomycetaceae bacterium]